MRVELQIALAARMTGIQEAPGYRIIEAKPERHPAPSEERRGQSITAWRPTPLGARPRDPEVLDAELQWGLPAREVPGWRLAYEGAGGVGASVLLDRFA